MLFRAHDVQTPESTVMHLVTTNLCEQCPLGCVMPLKTL